MDLEGLGAALIGSAIAVVVVCAVAYLLMMNGCVWTR